MCEANALVGRNSKEEKTIGLLPFLIISRQEDK